MRSWLIIIGIAVLFVCWGLFVFFTIGDKGSPPWDFGVVKDIPGESPYSTHRYTPGVSPAPSPQHVSEKPAGAGTEGKRK
jgi:hypothetical protein